MADDLSDAAAAEQRVAFTEFDTWISREVDHSHLNELHEMLRERCGPQKVGAWVYDRWARRLPHLRAIRVSGPDRDGQSDEPRYVVPVHTYTPTAETV